jgi:hypothetical protein
VSYKATRYKLRAATRSKSQVEQTVTSFSGFAVNFLEPLD